jgi:hypothetical protein
MEHLRIRQIHHKFWIQIGIEIWIWKQTRIVKEKGGKLYWANSLISAQPAGPSPYRAPSAVNPLPREPRRQARSILAQMHFRSVTHRAHQTVSSPTSRNNWGAHADLAAAREGWTLFPSDALRGIRRLVRVPGTQLDSKAPLSHPKWVREAAIQSAADRDIRRPPPWLSARSPPFGPSQGSRVFAGSQGWCGAASSGKVWRPRLMISSPGWSSTRVGRGPVIWLRVHPRRHPGDVCRWSEMGTVPSPSRITTGAAWNRSMVSLFHRRPYSVVAGGLRVVSAGEYLLRWFIDVAVSSRIVYRFG